jgi:hypothetical protein
MTWLFPAILLGALVARAQETHRAIFPPLADFFSILLEGDQFEIKRSFDKPGASEGDDAE